MWECLPCTWFIWVWSMTPYMSPWIPIGIISKYRGRSNSWALSVVAPNQAQRNKTKRNISNVFIAIFSDNHIFAFVVTFFIWVNPNSPEDFKVLALHSGITSCRLQGVSVTRLRSVICRTNTLPTATSLRPWD